METKLNGQAMELPPARKKTVYLVLAMLVGALGAHNFYAWQNRAGVSKLGLTFGWYCAAVAVIGFGRMIVGTPSFDWSHPGASVEQPFSDWVAYLGAAGAWVWGVAEGLGRDRDGFGRWLE